MNIKSLLIGSAALMTVSSGAYAADAVVMAEPEPVEYVRVCDVYGAGFFYIPGTETCLKIGGYIRDEIRFLPGFAGYWNRARFTPTFDARSETEWGTLRGYAEVEINADTFGGATPATNIGTAQYFNIAHAFIEVSNGSGTFRIGRTHSPYSRFLGYGASNLTNDGAYGFNNQAEISYTFTGSNGFSGIIALVDNPAGGAWQTNVEGGVNFAQGWGSIGAIAGYDGVTSTWGAKGVLRFKAANSGFSGGLHVFYTSGVGTYQVSAFQTNWSILGHVSFAVSPKVAIAASAQWFDTGVWNFVGGVAFTPVTNLLIRPEITYSSAGAGVWGGLIRFQRTF